MEGEVVGMLEPVVKVRQPMDTDQQAATNNDESNLNLVAWVLIIVMLIFIIGMLLYAWHKTSAELRCLFQIML
jgi:hypothetical protein